MNVYKKKYNNFNQVLKMTTHVSATNSCHPGPHESFIQKLEQDMLLRLSRQHVLFQLSTS